MGVAMSDQGEDLDRPITEARFTLEQLAARSGMSPRNIRAHQTRGLLPGPQTDGRLVWYDASHLARLRTITALQRRGFNLAAIERMLAEEGDLAALMLRRRTNPARASLPVDDDVVVAPEAIASLRLADPALPELLEAAALMRRRPDGEWMVSAALSALAAALWDRGVDWARLDTPVSDVGVAGASTARLLAGELVALARADTSSAREARERIEGQAALATAFCSMMFEVALVRTFQDEVAVLLGGEGAGPDGQGGPARKR
jgi:DNA-binding transcriptional MerR regulator